MIKTLIKQTKQRRNTPYGNKGNKGQTHSQHQIERGNVVSISKSGTFPLQWLSTSAITQGKKLTDTN